MPVEGQTQQSIRNLYPLWTLAIVRPELHFYIVFLFVADLLLPRKASIFLKYQLQLG